ncbi:penicillin-insensitive murein endopeptidase [Pseudoduganella aquatica]|uniref:Replication initiation protein n=1 Tax=Pseudoduganella aquatica TaxID=2660641 RepID=A0A7X4HA32_9BURK|nr:penicillin-insensitive murein endopeptidase [Pseudoduganella aquatica]MYN07416.1 replication initiation protein [Pseudoduganella aquatica]
MKALPIFGLVCAVCHIQAAGAVESECHGRTASGRVERSVPLPVRGENFSAYSTLAASAGRTYVHSTVGRVVGQAYAALAASRPATHYVYGETGLKNGGPFNPHKTHQNGTSVDFFVPVLDAEGKSALLPSTPLNRYGYDIEFDAQARYGDYRIDFPAMAEHLYQLRLAALAQKTDLALVIFDPRYLPQLLATPRGPYLRRHLRFMQDTPWVRHDEHYHVDFAIACAL